jgi:hypothetical protein
MNKSKEQKMQERRGKEKRQKGEEKLQRAKINTAKEIEEQQNHERKRIIKGKRKGEK